MKIERRFFIVLFIGTQSVISCNAQKSGKPLIKEENVTYTADGTTLDGFVAYDLNREGKRPAILIVHEWWGLNEYSKMRARQLAEMGYIAMAVDMYGNGKTAANPREAQALTTPF